VNHSLRTVRAFFGESKVTFEIEKLKVTDESGPPMRKLYVVVVACPGRERARGLCEAQSAGEV